LKGWLVREDYEPGEPPTLKAICVVGITPAQIWNELCHGHIEPDWTHVEELAAEQESPGLDMLAGGLPKRGEKP
jgi:hypothetical protein